MACFVVPLVQAVATSIWRKAATKAIADPASGALLRNLPALEKMLWGGSVMLIVDHIINGELTWMFPFFTALEQEGGGAVMLRDAHRRCAHEPCAHRSVGDMGSGARIPQKSNDCIINSY